MSLTTARMDVSIAEIIKTTSLHRIAMIDEEIEILFDNINNNKIKIVPFIKTYNELVEQRVALVVALMSALSHMPDDGDASVKMTDEANLLYPSACEKGTANSRKWVEYENLHRDLRRDLRRDRRDIKRDLLADPDNLELQELLAETISELEKIKQ